MKTSELTDIALDWAVAKCEGQPEETLDPLTWECTAYPSGCYNYSTNWVHGGPIIEREGISLSAYLYESIHGIKWSARLGTDAKFLHQRLGPTPLIAAMRCYVTSKLGDEVEIPEELR
jgi:hypothetical protein